MSFLLAVLLLAVVTGVTCALPGAFLVLRHQSMLIDAMSHAVLPGIVIGAIITGTAHSPLMVVLASAMGLLVVFGAEKMRATRLLSGDASQGVIFPALFAGGVLLMSTALKNVHICEDTVLTGDLNLMALSSERVYLFDGALDAGPGAMWVLLGVFALDILFVVLAYKVLQSATFDRQFATVIGYPVKLVESLLMVMVALTIVVAFSTAGTILVIAFMVVPAASALLLTKTLPKLILLTELIAVFTAVFGFWLALKFDLATSAMMAFTDGVVFLVIFVLVKVNRWLAGKRLNS